MADLSGIESFSVVLDSQLNRLAIPTRYRYMQELWIQVRIVQRNPEVGSIRLLSPFPRIWSGYYYLLSENCVFKHGAVEWQNQEIYRQLNLSWSAEIAVNENAYNLSTPEVPVDVDTVDEAAENDLWLGTSDLKNIYLPLQLPIDSVAFYIPSLCEFEVLISGRKFSPISAFGIGNDTDLYEDLDMDDIPDLLIPTPLNSLAFPPMDVNSIESDLDQIARANGYVTAAECTTALNDSTKIIVTESGLMAQQILDKLLENNAINQSNIDDYLSSDPAASPDDILNGLIDGGIASNPEVSKAITDILGESPYPTNPLKKYSWFIVFYEKIGTGCPDNYKAIRCFYTSTNVKQATEIYSSTVPPTPSTINWSSVARGDSPYSMAVGWDLYEAFNPVTACGQTKSFYQAAIDSVPLGNVYRSATTPQVVFFLEP